jgi:hypothetical protein
VTLSLPADLALHLLGERCVIHVGDRRFDLVCVKKRGDVCTLTFKEGSA